MPSVVVSLHHTPTTSTTPSQTFLVLQLHDTRLSRSQMYASLNMVLSYLLFALIQSYLPRPPPPPTIWTQNYVSFGPGMYNDK